MTKPEGSEGFIPAERPLPTPAGVTGGAAPRSAWATRVSPRGDSVPRPLPARRGVGPGSLKPEASL